MKKIKTNILLLTVITMISFSCSKTVNTPAPNDPAALKAAAATGPQQHLDYEVRTQFGTVMENKEPDYGYRWYIVMDDGTWEVPEALDDMYQKAELKVEVTYSYSGKTFMTNTGEKPMINVQYISLVKTEFNGGTGLNGGKE